MRRIFLLASAAALLAAPALAQTSSGPAQAPGRSTAPAAPAVPGAHPMPSTAAPMRLSTQEFIRKAQMGDRFEIASSRLAQQQAGSEAVKGFAAEMVRDHTRTTQELTELLQRTRTMTSSAGQPAGSQMSSAAQPGGAASSSTSRAGASGAAGSAAGGGPAQGGTTSGVINNTETSGGAPTEGLDAEHQQLMQRLQQARGAEFDRLYVQAQVQAHQQAVDMFTAYSQSGDQAELKQWAAKTLPELQRHLQRAQQLQRSL